MDASEVTRHRRDRTLYASFLAQRNRVNGGCANSIRMENGKGTFSAGLLPDLKEGELFTTSEQRDAILSASSCTNGDDVYMVGIFIDNPLSGYDTNGIPLTNMPDRISNDSNIPSMFLSCFSSSLDLKWITRIGSDNARMDESSIIVGKDGYLYVSASVHNDDGISSDVLFYDVNGSDPSIRLSPVFIPGTEDYSKTQLIIAKYSINGAAQWATHVDMDSILDLNPSIALDSTNHIYISIGAYNKMCFYQVSNNTTPASTINYTSSYQSYLLKYTTSGEYTWVTHVGGSNDYTQVVCDKQNNIYITSESDTDIDIYNASDLDTPVTTINRINDSWYNWIIKYNPSGEYLWATRFGGSDDSYFSMNAIDSQNNIYFMGVYYNSTVSIYSATAINTVVATLPNSGDYDIAIIKYNSSGVYQWSTHLSSVGEDREVSIAVDKDDNVVFAGRVSNSTSLDLYDTTSDNPIKTMNFATNYSVIVAKYSSLGHHLWSSYVNDSFSESFFYSSIQTDSVGNVYLTANLNAENVGFYDTSSNLVFVLSKTGTETYHTYMAKFSPNGMPQYATRIVNIYYGNLGTVFKP